jgi:hypothetical protein
MKRSAFARRAIPDVVGESAPARLKRRLSIQRRSNRAGEIGGPFHQLVGAGRFKLVAAAISLQHAETAHVDRVGAPMAASRGFR